MMRRREAGGPGHLLVVAVDVGGGLSGSGGPPPLLVGRVALAPASAALVVQQRRLQTHTHQLVLDVGRQPVTGTAAAELLEPLRVAREPLLFVLKVDLEKEVLLHRGLFVSMLDTMKKDIGWGESERGREEGTHFLRGPHSRPAHGA